MKKITLVLLASLILFTTASYAEYEELVAQLAEVQGKLMALQESNNDLKKTLASRENEIEGWKLALENIEAETAGMEKK
jgi:predicted nuclease with TOPRIM domain